MIINIDTMAKAAYIKVREGKYHHTKEVLPEVFVDFDSKGHALGLELISPCTVTLHKIAKKLRLPLLNRIKKPLEEICS